MSNPIVAYIVQLPGCTPLSSHATEAEARKQCESINRICCPGHQVFAQHADGTVTGPL